MEIQRAQQAAAGVPDLVPFASLDEDKAAGGKRVAPRVELFLFHPPIVQNGPPPAKRAARFCNKRCCYLLPAGPEAGSAPDWVPVLPAPEPEPMPPELGTAPEVPPGVDVVPPALEPLPLVMPSSFRHFSRSVPVMPRHLLLLLPEEAPLLLGEALLGELLLGELLLGEALLGELLLGELAPLELLPVAPVELLPDAPEEPEEELSEEPLPVAPALVPAPPPVLPAEEPELCASEAPESANSAAAVAAVMSFNVISVFPYLLVPEGAPPVLPEPMPEPLLLPVPEPGVLAAPPLLPDAPPLGVLLLPVLPPDAAPEPDFLKYASHSSRETCPSPFLSTDEKLGVCEVAPLDAPDLGALEAPPEALLSDDLPAALLSDDLPDALLLEDPLAALSGDLVSAALGLELDPDAPVEPEVCAAATLASAKSAAAVAVPTTLANM